MHYRWIIGDTYLTRFVTAIKPWPKEHALRQQRVESCQSHWVITPPSAVNYWAITSDKNLWDVLQTGELRDFSREKWQPLRSADNAHFFPALALQPSHYPTLPRGAGRNGGSQFLPLPMEINHSSPRGCRNLIIYCSVKKKTLHRYHHQEKTSCALLHLFLPYSFKLNEELL